MIPVEATTRRSRPTRWPYHPAWSRAALAITAGFTLWCTYWSATCDVVRHHDFFGFVERARDFQAGRSSDWIHPLYPVGYPLLLRGVAEATGSYLSAGHLISVLAGMVWVLGVYLVARRCLPPAVAVLVQFVAAVHPQSQLYATKEGTDLAAAALILLAAAVMLSRSSRRRWVGGAVGALLGVGYLIRYTTLLVVPAFLVGDWLAGRPRRAPWPMAAAFLLAAGLQLVPTTLAKANPFWTGQAQNVWFGLNDYSNYQRHWNRYPGTGLFGLVAEDPGRFAGHVVGNLHQAVETIARQTRVPWPVGSGVLLWLLIWSGYRRRVIWGNALFLVAVAACLAVGLSLAFANRRLLLPVYPLVFVLLAMWWWHALGGVSGGRAAAAWAARAATLAVFIAAGGVPVHRLGVSHVETWEEPLRLHRRQITGILREAGVQRADQVATFCMGCQYLADDRQIHRFVPGEALVGQADGGLDFDRLHRSALARGIGYLCATTSRQDPYPEAFPRLAELFNPATRPGWLVPVDQAHRHLILRVLPAQPGE